MKKSSTILVILLLMSCIGTAQDTWLDSIQHALSVANSDTGRLLTLYKISGYYRFRRPDSTMFYGAKALTLARQIKYPKGEIIEVMINMVLTQNALGNQAKALQIVLEAIKIAEKNNLILEKAKLLLLQGFIYNQSKDYEKALKLCMEAKNLFVSLHDTTFFALAQIDIGDTFLMLNQPDSALYYCQSAYDNQLKGTWVNYQAAFNLGKIQEKMDNTDLALSLYRQSLPLTDEPSYIFDSNLAIAQLYQKIGQLDSCIYYGEKSLLIAQESKFISKMIDVHLFLSGIYEKTDTEKALQYSKTAIAYKDSLYKLANKTAQETFIGYDEQERQQKIESAHTKFQNRLRMNAFLGTSFTLLVIAIFLFWNSRLKQKAKRNIEKAYDQLKSTQSQLIQSEKMASLGELTAGIAHEIQNPLNFVNNFSEISNELLSEMKIELENNHKEEAIALAEDVKQNLEKILHHGQRADGIVKGMLQHSRSSSGSIEPTDINQLADEYFHLAFHGLSARDQSFNAILKTEFDRNIGNIPIIPQDMGRVIHQLITNAFYAVTEKMKQHLDAYEPTVWVSTKKRGDKVLISVKDNGMGIPSKIRDKIFQPFFTTKPTGEGTGLGLSMSYDIVKAHGGELKVETKEGEGSEFIIQIPI
ncbi:MAG TPA: ATP-binding protein [Prolixibacteraceae bacterium]|jgi:signal transduction histidine kinase